MPGDSEGLEEGECECVKRRDGDQDEEGVKIQLLSSSSVAVSTSQDFDDNATITAFWEERKNNPFRSHLV